MCGEYAHFPVMFLSDRLSIDEEEHCLAVEALDYIVKRTWASILVYRVTNLIMMVAQLKKLAEVSCTDRLTGLANKM